MTTQRHHLVQPTFKKFLFVFIERAHTPDSPLEDTRERLWGGITYMRVLLKPCFKIQFTQWTYF